VGPAHKSHNFLIRHCVLLELKGAALLHFLRPADNDAECGADQGCAEIDLPYARSGKFRHRRIRFDPAAGEDGKRLLPAKC